MIIILSNKFIFFRHGAEVIDADKYDSLKKPSTFSGIGYRLGQSNSDSEGLSVFYFITDYIIINN